MAVRKFSQLKKNLKSWTSATERLLTKWEEEGVKQEGSIWLAISCTLRSQRRRTFMFILTLIHFTWGLGGLGNLPRILFVIITRDWTGEKLWLCTLYTNVISDLFLSATKRKAFIVFWNLPPFNPPCPWSSPSLIKNSSNNWGLLRTPYWMRTI